MATFVAVPAATGGVAITFAGFTGELKSIDGPNPSRDMVDATHLASPDGWRTYLPGMKDGGTLSVAINFDPANKPPIEGAAGTLTISFPGGASWACTAMVQDFKVSVQLGDLAELQCTFKLTGKPAFIA